MHAVAVVGGSRAVGRGADEWVRELDSRTDREQPGINRRVGGGRLQAERLGGTMEQHRVAERLGGRRQDEQLGVGRELLEALGVALLDPAATGLAVGKPEPAGELGGVPGARQLEKRERIAVALGDDLVADRGVEGAVHVVQQQRPRVAVAESADGQLGQARRGRRRRSPCARRTRARPARRAGGGRRTRGSARRRGRATARRRRCRRAVAARRPRRTASAWPARPGTDPARGRRSARTRSRARRAAGPAARRGDPAWARRAGGGRL